MRFTEITDYTTCQEKWYWRWWCGYVPSKDHVDSALNIGSLCHKYVHISCMFNQQEAEKCFVYPYNTPDTMRIRCLVRNLSDFYLNWCKNNGYELMASELVVSKTGEPPLNINHTGTIDALYLHNNHIVLSDLKTVSDVLTSSLSYQMRPQLYYYLELLRSVITGLGRVDLEYHVVPKCQIKGKRDETEDDLMERFREWYENAEVSVVLSTGTSVPFYLSTFSIANKIVGNNNGLTHERNFTACQTGFSVCPYLSLCTSNLPEQTAQNFYMKVETEHNTRRA